MTSITHDQLAHHKFGTPTPELTYARGQCPVFRDDSGTVNVTRYDDVVQVLTDSDTYSSNIMRLPPLPDEFRGKLPENILASAQVNLDPPEHTVVRRTVTRAFTGRRMAAMEPTIRDIAKTLINGFADHGQCELMSSYSYRLLAKIFPAMLGLDDEDMRQLTTLNDDMYSLMMQAGSFGPLDVVMSPADIEQRYSPEAVRERYQRMVNTWDHLGRVLDQKRHNPGTDLASAMLQTKNDDGEPAFTNDEMIVHMATLLAASGGTTGNLIGTLVVLFDRNPDQLALVRENPQLFENAIDEALRTCPSRGVVPRRAVRDVELHGVPITAGSMVAASLDGAAHDESHFEDPYRFDITRANAKEHVSFGRGRHMCSGFPLGRLTTRVALIELYDRLPGLHVSGRVQTDSVPGRRLLTHVDVAWDRERKGRTQ